MVKKKGFVALFVVLSMVSAWSVCYSLDTELYVLSGVDIPPNVVIILDSSASMDDVSSGQNYNPDPEHGIYGRDIDYGQYNPLILYGRYEVFIKSGSNWVKVVTDLSSGSSDYRNLVGCDALKALLDAEGQANNFSGCNYNKKDFQIGNFRNFLQLTEGPGGSRSRFGLANGIIHSYINTTGGVRFSLMVFNRDSAGKIVMYDKLNPNKGEYVFGNSQDDALDANGGRVLGFVNENKDGKDPLFVALDGFKNDSWSPLAETLYDAGGYFKSGKDGYSSPVQYTCQKNYVLIISDGTPTKDSDSRLDSFTDVNNNGKLDEVSKYLYDELDLSNGTATNKQNIKTYTIGFSMTHSLLESTARNGGGKYFYVYSSQSFNVAFQTFIADVLKDSTSYVAPVVPISQMERTSAGNRMYLAMFKPTERSFWKGNIKKYGIATETSTGIKFGDILDATGAPAISGNKIRDEARSYWSLEPDGEDVDEGGVGKKLFDRTSARNIYTYPTYVGANTNLTDASNAFTTTNSAITAAMLDVSGDTEKEDLINFVHGLDAYDWDRWDPDNNTVVEGLPDTNTNHKRKWILGAFIHSRPTVIHYDTSHSVIFAGANDGMLHAFDDESGEELWAFIPPSLLGNLKNLTNPEGDIQFYVDGAPKAYIERNSNGEITKGILIFGLRRGGNRYIALDIKERLQPKFLWEISPTQIVYQTTITPSTEYNKLGQTWSTPQIAKIKYGTGEKWVGFVGGGYDENQDNIPVTNNDTVGTAVYVIDILNGSRIWSYSIVDNSSMKYSIPSDISRVDTNGDGKIDRLYVGDTGGQMWRFDIADPNPSNWKNAGKVKVIFNSNPGASEKRKIFYPPEVTLEKGNYEMLFFGTGDREHPKWRSSATGIVDRLYAVKDKNPSTVLTETNNLADVTLDLLQVGTQAEQEATLSNLEQKDGWFIKLEQNSEEKCLANAVIFYGVVYYTTFVPSIPAGICSMDPGKGRLYALQYRTGNAVFNLDGSDDPTELTRSDRSMEIGVSIPSGVIVTFIKGVTVGYGGVGGGVYRPPIPTAKTLFPLGWRIVF